MSMVELRGLSALEAWSRKVTNGYKDVKVHDLSSSWRDGLAFCALIHHFRPDLIDFDCLSKENILYNNRLAFAIAEKHLNVPSLLDAEDMLKYEEPDRLSVATYLSQFYERFEGSKSDRKPSFSAINNRKSATNTDETDTNNRVNVVGNNDNNAEHPPIPPKRDMRCQVCRLRVFILERVIVDDSVYHKSCYDRLHNNNNSNDNKNNSELNEEDVGQLSTGCALDIHDNIKGDNSAENSLSDNKLNAKPNESVILSSDFNKVCLNDDKCDEQLSVANGVESNVEISTANDNLHEETVLETADDAYKCRIAVSYENDESIDVPDAVTIASRDERLNVTNLKCDTTEHKDEDNSLCDPINERNAIQIALSSSTDKSLTSGNDYPDEKNPFDDDNDDEEHNSRNDKLYPKDMNPFGDDDGEDDSSQHMLHSSRAANRSQLNPFGDDDDEKDQSRNGTPIPMPRRSVLIISDKSPTASLRLTPRKKRPAPTPPSSNKSNTQITCSSVVNNINTDSTGHSRRESISSTLSSEMAQSSTPSSRTPTPLPRAKLRQSCDDLSNSAVSHDSFNKSNNSIKSTVDSESDLKNTFGYWKTKKRPAPPIPAFKRIIKGSIVEIQDELISIGEQLPVVERRGVELENAIRNGGDDQNAVDDQIMDQFLSTARERCRLARRQKELMYMKREHKLEEIQADIEYQMRVVMSKQSAQKTEEDEKKEDELLQRLVEIIEERNDIVENMIRDENKEVEEYRKLISKVVPNDDKVNYLVAKVSNGVNNGGKTKEEPKNKQSLTHKKEKHKDKEKKKHKKEKPTKEFANDSKASSKIGETKSKESKSYSVSTLGKSTLRRLGMKAEKSDKRKSVDKGEKSAPDVSSGSSVAINE